MFLLAEANTEAEIVEQVEELTNINIEEVKPSVLMETLQGYIPSIINFGINLLICIIIYLVGKKIISLIRKIVKRSLERSSVDKGVEQFIDSLLKFGLYLVLIMIIAGRLGVETASIITIVGSAGVAVGLALQGSLSNFAGGVLILVLKPFKVGDYIIASGNEGAVKQIQIFYTKLTTGDNKEIMIPNGSLMNSNIINVTGQTERRLDILVGISYDADILEAKRQMELVAKKESTIITEKDIDVYVDSLAESCVNIGLRVWVPTDEYFGAKCRITENLKLAFDEAGIDIPYNQLAVHIVENK